jgi:hypothetical protein
LHHGTCTVVAVGPGRPQGPPPVEVLDEVAVVLHQEHVVTVRRDDLLAGDKRPPELSVSAPASAAAGSAAAMSSAAKAIVVRRMPRMASILADPG